jgi:hypothetical protein
MKRLRRAACAAIIGVTALAGYVVVAGAQQMGVTADEQAIRQVITEMTEGFNSHDGRPRAVCTCRRRAWLPCAAR